MNYTKFLNATSLARQPSPIRLLTALKALSGPSMISLAGGNPNPSLFPFQEATFKLWNGKKLHLSEESLNVALQYDASAGVSHLVKRLMEMQKRLHRPPLSKTNELDLCITSGSLDGLTKSFEMLVSTGDQVLIEQPLCSHVISALKPLECTIVPLETDSHGITPSSLAQISKCGNNSMKFLYTSPNGSVPAGITTTLERKEMVYKFAQENDLLILENDPYSFLQYTKEPVPSYLSMDVDGRVLRFDSLSTVISPGLQIGYVTGAKALIERIVLHVMVSSMHVSTLSQVMTHELLKELGYDGFKDYTNSVAEFFKDKLKVVLRAADKYLKDSVEWTVPHGGVCLWMKLKNGYQYVGEFEETIGSSHIIFASGKHFFVDPPSHATDYIVAFFYYCFEDSDDSIDYSFKELSQKLKEVD